MRDVRIALAQIAPCLGDVAANVQLHLEAIDQARQQKADLVVFPELSLTGYVLRDQVPDVALRQGDPALLRLEEAAQGLDIVFGFVEETPGHLYHNAAAYLTGGRRLHLHRKIYLPTYGMFQEGRDFAGGHQLRCFPAPSGPAGLLICEDLWHQTSTWLLAHQGAETLFVLSNSPSRGARPGLGVTSLGVWERLLQVSAQFHTTFMVYVNRVGCEDGLTFAGGSSIIDPFGRVVESLPALESAVVTVPLEAELLRRARTAYPLLRDDDLDLVERELGRVRRARYDLDEEPESSPVDNGTERSGS